MKLTTVATFVMSTLAASAASLAEQAAAPQSVVVSQKYDIAAQPISDALNAFAAQSGLQVAIDWTDTTGIRSGRLFGNFTPLVALDKLLSGTGLTYQLLNDHTVAVRSKPDPTEAKSTAALSPITSSVRVAWADPSSKDTDSGPQYSPSSTPENNGNGAQSSAAAREPAGSLQEVIVTAQKRDERIQDVPMSISAIDPQALIDSNQLTLTDYYASVPGIAVAPLPMGGVNVSIRGITSEGIAAAQATATTGVLVDGVPIPTSGLYVPDLDPDDLQRIEVLRGPQGTLYGASSMGGLINYITKDPSFQTASGHIEAGTSTVYNGGWGYTARGSANLPISDDLAVRVNGFTRENPGYIDNPYTGNNGVNVEHTSGGHVSVFWKPSDQFNVKLSALYQRLTAQSTSDITTTNEFTGQSLGDLQQVYAGNSTAYEHEEGDFSAIMTYLFHDLQITSNTAYNFSHRYDSLDLSAAIGSYSQIFLHAPPTYILDYNFHFSGFTEELRASGPLGPHLDGRVALYYNFAQSNPQTAGAWAVNPVSGQRVAQWATFNSSPPGGVGENDETAVFADLTYHVTSQWDIQLGARESRLRQYSSEEIITGPYVGDLLDSPPTNATLDERYTVPAKENPFTYLASTQYKLTPGMMAYFRAASGFRAGSANSPDLVVLGAPAEQQPDKLTSYEIGFKGTLSATLSTELSLYYIDWKDIQIQAVTSHIATSFGTNGGAAKSEGVDVTMRWRPIAELSVASWISYDDAIITSYPANATGFYAAPGMRLPLSAQVSGNVSVDYIRPISDSMGVFAGAAASYVGGRESLFTSSTDRTYLPAYVKSDLRGGVNYGPWKVNLYVNNVANSHGVISGGLGNAVSDSFYLITPRTIGVAFGRTF